MRRYRPWFGYVIFALVAIGIVAKLVRSPGPLLIPLVVFGVVFWLYKFPPNRLRRRGHQGGRSTGQQSRGTASKKARFRVIRGNKRDDDPPRYH